LICPEEEEMFVVTVNFLVKEEHGAEFMTAMLEQARNSLNLEESCRRFDVCQDAEDPRRVFLYEIYDDASAFQDHLRSDHFADFSSTTSSWVADKSVDTWNLEFTG